MKITKTEAAAAACKALIASTSVNLCDPTTQHQLMLVESFIACRPLQALGSLAHSEEVARLARHLEAGETGEATLLELISKREMESLIK